MCIRDSPEYRDKNVKTTAGDALIDTMNLPEGCLYHPRCPYACDQCSREEPVEIEVEPGHLVKCFCNMVNDKEEK